MFFVVLMEFENLKLNKGAVYVLVVFMCFWLFLVVFGCFYVFLDLVGGGFSE